MTWIPTRRLIEALGALSPTMLGRIDPDTVGRPADGPGGPCLLDQAFGFALATRPGARAATLVVVRGRGLPDAATDDPADILGRMGDLIRWNDGTPYTPKKRATLRDAVATALHRATEEGPWQPR